MSRYLRKILNENCTNEEVKRAIREQAIVCDGLMRPLTKEHILKLCKLENSIQVCNALHAYKLA